MHSLQKSKPRLEQKKNIRFYTQLVPVRQVYTDGWVNLSFCCLVRILISCDSFICTLCKTVIATKLKTVKSNHFKYVKRCSADYLLCLNIQVNLRIIRMKLMQFMDTLLLFFSIYVFTHPFLFKWVLQILIGYSNFLRNVDLGILFSIGYFEDGLCQH